MTNGKSIHDTQKFRITRFGCGGGGGGRLQATQYWKY